jgi:hypothetical protein
LSACLDGRGTELKSFTICGSDGEFVPATATLDGDTIMVDNIQIEDPIRMRGRISLKKQTFITKKGCRLHLTVRRIVKEYIAI